MARDWYPDYAAADLILFRKQIQGQDLSGRTLSGASAGEASTSYLVHADPDRQRTLRRIEESLYSKDPATYPIPLPRRTQASFTSRGIAYG